MVQLGISFPEPMQNSTTNIADLKTALEHLKDGQSAQAEAICQSIIENDSNNAEAFQVLASVKISANEPAEAKRLLERAIELNPTEPNYFNSLGTVLNRLGHRQEAWASLERALEIAPDHADALDNIATLLRNDEDLVRAIGVFTKAIKDKADNLGATTNRAISSCLLMKQRFGTSFYPQGFNPEPTQTNTTSSKVYEPWVYTYIYVPFYKALYAPVPKVACSSLKMMIYGLLKELVPELPAFSDQPDDELNFHLFMDRSLSMAQFPRHEANEILASDQIFKFAFVRNPFHRIASAYLDKFVTERVNPDQWSHTWPVFNSVYGYNTDLRNDQISFRQFVTYLTTADDAEIDKHWAPMHQMVKVKEMNFIGRLESMEADFNKLRETLGLPPQALPHINRSGGRTIEAGRGELKDVGNHDLAKLDSLPRTVHLYDSELEEMIVQRYKLDFEQLGYSEKLDN